MVNITIEDCHKFGLLHDAVAIVLFNKDDSVLLILRSDNNLGGGKWEIPATHCFGSGYFPDGYRCLKDEISVENIQLDYLGDFHYQCEGFCKDFPQKKFIENEMVHVLIAEFNGIVKPNMSHCSEFMWIPLSWILYPLKPDNFAYWLHEGIVAMYDKVCDYIDKKRGRIG